MILHYSLPILKDNDNALSFFSNANTLTITNDFLGSFFGSWNGLRKTMAYQIGPTVLNLVILAATKLDL